MRCFLPVLAVLAPMFVVSGCERPAARADVAAGRALPERSVAAFRLELLELAFEAASSIPQEPHVKDRSRVQQGVVEAYLVLDQPSRALAAAGRIENWRRNLCYASLACYWAERGAELEARRCLALVGPLDREDQQWRRDRVLARMAQARARLDDAGRTGESASADSSGRGARTPIEGPLDANQAAWDAPPAGGDFELLNSALRGATQLCDQVYDDPDRRAAVQERIRASWGRLPVIMRLELLFELARIARDHGDLAASLTLIHEARALFDGCAWSLEDRLPPAARLVVLRGQAGEREAALAEADALFELFAQNRREIPDIYRARALRPLAEAYFLLGATDAALLVFRHAIEEGAANPNARPRAEDLAATCTAMARLGVEPDGRLWARIRQIRSELRQPW